MVSKDPGVVTLRRTFDPPYIALFGGWGLMIMCMAVWGISDGFTTWKLPVWKMELGPAIFVTVFMSFWFGFLLFIVWMTLTPLHRVKISGEDIRICLGPFTLRRLSAMDVLTVVRTGEMAPLVRNVTYMHAPKGTRIPSAWRLVLSTIPAEQLREKARNAATRYVHTVPNHRVCKYMEKAFFRNRFWLEWSQEAEDALRKALPGAEFIR